MQQTEFSGLTRGEGQGMFKSVLVQMQYQAESIDGYLFEKKAKLTFSPSSA
ncbi:hypothetical protein GCM10022278_11390 [Allohahella marinimesophila]|uniref:Uncharacterized protein n=1 Tax=Allohahella marinimesophila TaxID=1054972 RepID=A0ABP7NUH7_9GAMM